MTGEDATMRAGDEAEPRETRMIVVAAVAVVLLAVARATIGVDLHDGTQYLVAPLRLAQGARLFADEMPVQTLGFLASVPFMKVWTAFFGLSGLSLATRLYYVALATGVAVACYLLLRRSFRPTFVALAIALPLLGPPYHLFLPSYNTMSELAFMLAACLAFGAVRDDDAAKAAGAGVALVLGTVSYPSLIGAALALFAMFALFARHNRRLLIACIASAAVVAGVCAIAFFSAVTLTELRAALSYAAANVSRANAPVSKMVYYVYRIVRSLVSVALWPMWGLVVLASAARMAPRTRALALAAIPLAAVIPSALVITHGDGYTFGALAPTWFITFLAGIAVPTVLSVRRSPASPTRRLMIMTAPPALIGFVSIAYSTGSSWNRGVAAVALAPLAIALVIGWAEEIGRQGEGYLQVTWAFALAALIVVLFGTVFLDQAPLTRRVLITRGPYAGQTASPATARRLADIERMARQSVSPDDRVLVIGIENAYLLVGGKIHTCSVWLEPKESDAAAVEYFGRPGNGWPSVVLVDDTEIRRRGGYAHYQGRDLLMARVLSDYVRVGGVDSLSVFRKKPKKPQDATGSDSSSISTRL